MKITDYTFAIDEFHRKNIKELLPEDALLFDIETTGFQANYETIYLIGCGFRQGDSITIRLFYAPTPAQEGEILLAFYELLSSYHTLISFNGERFDIPFVEKRWEKCHLSGGIFSDITSIDLFQTAKRYKSLLNLEHYNQKTLERYFGLFREDVYNGGQLIEIYKRQATAFDAAEEATLFLHNMEDVKGMVTLLSLLEFPRVLSPELSEFSLDVSKPSEIVFSARMDIDTNLCLRIRREHLFVQIKDDRLSAILTPYAGTLKYFYPDYKNYVWIPEEGLLLPKTLAASIDKSRQQKATRENCFAKKEGLFLPKLLPSEEREFQMDCRDKRPYIEIDPATLTPRYVAEYVLAAIQPFSHSPAGRCPQF